MRLLVLLAAVTLASWACTSGGAAAPTPYPTLRAYPELAYGPTPTPYPTLRPYPTLTHGQAEAPAPTPYSTSALPPTPRPTATPTPTPRPTATPTPTPRPTATPALPWTTRSVWWTRTPAEPIVTLTIDDWADRSIMLRHEGRVASIRDLWLTDFDDVSASHHFGEQEVFRYIGCIFPYSWNDEIGDFKRAMVDALRWGDYVTFTGRVAFYPGDHYQLSDCVVTPSPVASLTKDDWLDPSVMERYEGRVVSIGGLELAEVSNRGAHYRYPDESAFIHCRFPYPVSAFPFPRTTVASRYLSQATLSPGETVTFTGRSHYVSAYQLSDCMATRLPPSGSAGDGGGG